MELDAVTLLKQRGVYLHNIAEVVKMLQSPYSPDLTMDECLNAVKRVICKREVQFVILTGLALDMLAEDKKLPQPLQTIVERDEPLYGIDEVLAFGITNMYGSIGLTSFGYLDKQKIGILGEVHFNHRNKVNTFLDDIIAAIAAAAAAKIAHHRGVKQLQIKST